jgi:hypothetical protein
MADHDIFISYSKHDRARVERMVAALEGEGWTVYWDQRLVAGDAWHTQLAAALASARCVIVAWSTKSVASNWVRDEATQALQRGVLVPVLIEPVAIPLGFGQVHTIAVMDAAGNLLPDAVPDLCAGVRRHLGPGPTAGAPATRPIATAPAAASPAPPVRPRKPGRIARPLFPIVLPILTSPPCWRTSTTSRISRWPGCWWRSEPAWRRRSTARWRAPGSIASASPRACCRPCRSRPRRYSRSSSRCTSGR